MNPDEARPIVRCFVSFPLDADGLTFTAPALVSLSIAAEMKAKGYLVVGADPHDLIDLATWEKQQDRQAEWPFP
jgi:hypothetical protein